MVHHTTRSAVKSAVKKTTTKDLRFKWRDLYMEKLHEYEK